MKLLGTVLSKVIGTRNERELKRIGALVGDVNRLEPEMRKLAEADFPAKTEELRKRHAGGESLDDLQAEAFALCREAARRELDMRHFDVQLIGGAVLHEGKIAEMKTGEGKTLVATLSVYLNVLEGKGVHVVTVNDYLAQRDAAWMGPIYKLLGLKVGVIVHGLEDEERRAAYNADVTYGTNNEFGFDFLRDNMKFELDECVQRPHHYAIVDEVDSILIDEARTPLIISGASEESTEKYYRVDKVIPSLNRKDHYEVDEKHRTVTLNEEGVAKVESVLGLENLYDPANLEIVHHVYQALKAHAIFKRDRDYVVKDGAVMIVDEFTGRLMPGRRWSDGLHQAVEAKEGVKIERENQTLATITFQNYFRMHDKLAGMTGTAETEAAEFEKIYDLEVLVIPTNQTLIRNEFPDVVYRTEREKFQAVVEEIKECHLRGQPTLVGTIAIEKSERLSQQLRKAGVLPELVKQASKEAGLEGQKLGKWAETLAERHSGAVNWLIGAELTTAKLLSILDQSRFRSLKTAVNGNRKALVTALLKESKVDADRRPALERAAGDSLVPQLFELAKFATEKCLPLLDTLVALKAKPRRFFQVLQENELKHNVLNAKQHEREAEIVAQAGRMGSVTVSTNMAGRGTDILLGGNADSMSRDSLRKKGVNPDSATPEQRQGTLEKFQSQVEAEHGEVVDVGGLHILGTERHESRRIDNQLRGRAGRQGDPGSSRFYLSLEDDLLRIFAGERISRIMHKLGMEEGVPIESRLISKRIEAAQKTVESQNFESRKHLLEYDDVMNKQRETIYGLRRRLLEGREEKDYLMEACGRVADWLLGTYCPKDTQAEQWDLENLRKEFLKRFGINLKNHSLPFEAKLYTSLREQLTQIVRDRYDEREKVIGSERMRWYERMALLQVVDKQWKDHLLTMDHLKEGIGLRGYGHRDPLVEYKRESFGMFEGMMDRVEDETLRYLFLMRTPEEEEALIREYQRRKRREAAELRFSGGEAAAKPKTVVRGQKVGRNDPCPCGSGKKYKKCHGAVTSGGTGSGDASRPLASA